MMHDKTTLELQGQILDPPKGSTDSEPRHQSDRPRVLYVGLPAFTGSFAQDLLEELMSNGRLIEVAAITTPAPNRFQPLTQFHAIEFVQKDDFEYIERIERLHERHGYVLSQDVLNRHFETEYAYLSISDRRCLTDLPVRGRRRAYKELLAYWYDFLTTRRIDVIIVVGYPHAGWNNILVDVAKALSLKVVLIDFTVIKETTLVSEIERLHEPVPRERYAQMTSNQIHSEIPQGLRDRITAPLFGLDFSTKVKEEVQTGPDTVSYFALLASILRHPARRVRPSITRLSGGMSHPAMALQISRAKRHVVTMATRYRAISNSNPNLTRPYIYFPLHMQPERSTIPAGGIFDDQLLAAEILAAALPDGWSLYIKEHPSQFWTKRAVKQAWFRNEYYYRRLMALPRTELISLDYNTHDLIRSAKAVATITGTAGWEALLKNKICIAFGKPWYLGCNACIGVTSATECEAAVSTALASTESDVERCVLEFLHYYSDRILGVPFLPDRSKLPQAEYEDYTRTITRAILGEVLAGKRTLAAS